MSSRLATVTLASMHPVTECYYATRLKYIVYESWMHMSTAHQSCYSFRR